MPVSIDIEYSPARFVTGNEEINLAQIYQPREKPIVVYTESGIIVRYVDAITRESIGNISKKWK